MGRVLIGFEGAGQVTIASASVDHVVIAFDGAAGVAIALAVQACSLAHARGSVVSAELVNRATSSAGQVSRKGSAEQTSRAWPLHYLWASLDSQELLHQLSKYSCLSRII